MEYYRHMHIDLNTPPLHRATYCDASPMNGKKDLRHNYYCPLLARPSGGDGKRKGMRKGKVPGVSGSPQHTDPVNPCASVNTLPLCVPRPSLPPLTPLPLRSHSRAAPPPRRPIHHLAALAVPREAYIIRLFEPFPVAFESGNCRSRRLLCLAVYEAHFSSLVWLDR